MYKLSWLEIEHLGELVNNVLGWTKSNEVEVQIKQNPAVNELSIDVVDKRKTIIDQNAQIRNDYLRINLHDYNVYESNPSNQLLSIIGVDVRDLMYRWSEQEERLNKGN